MLSRVANSLYWMARHIERAENIARLVDVKLQLLLDQRNLDEAYLGELWLPVVEATGDEALFRERYPKATGQAVTEFLVFDESNPNSIMSAVCLAREDARTVRDQLTSELWEELNRIYLFVRSPQGRSTWENSPSDFFHQIKTASLNVIGLTYSTMLRNEGWWFIQAGKFIERADKTSRILDARHRTLPAGAEPGAVSQAEALGWSAVLRSCSAWDAYKAIHGADVRPALVAEFLMFNEAFPRSVRFSAGKLGEALRGISGMAPGRYSNAVERLVGRLEAELQFGTVEEILATGLHDHVDRLQGRLNDIGQALFDAYFFQPFSALSDEMLVQQEQQQQQAFGSGGFRRRGMPGRNS